METPKQSNQKEITCSNCSSRLTFAPGTNSLKCPSCGTMNNIEVNENERMEATKEIDFHDFLRNSESTEPKVEVLTVKCDGCGAETTFNPNIVSSECDFCGSPLTSKEGHTSGIIAPKAILPFKIQDTEGLEKYKTWLKKLWFAPNKLKAYARQSEKLSGVYIPYWTFDCDTISSYTGSRGDDYQDTERYSDNGVTKTRTVTKTRWSSAFGTVKRFFDDILVSASKSLPIKHVNDLEPWDLDNLVPYDTKYLSGFKSESYQISLEDGFTRATEKMAEEIQTDVRNDIGGDRQNILTLSTKYNNITFKHILLPIWISAYKYNEKVYRFMINGRTGEVQGERPWSIIKITFAVLAALATIGTIYYFSAK